MGRTSPLGGPTEQPCLWPPERACRLWRSSFPLVAVRVRLPTCRSYGGRPSAEDEAPPGLLDQTNICPRLPRSSWKDLHATPRCTSGLWTPPASRMVGGG